MTFLFMGFLVLGIGCICWALINIGAQSVRTESLQKTTETVLTGVTIGPTESEEPVELLNEAQVLYSEYPVEGDTIGSLSIPALEQEIPIIQGTGVAELKNGVGHFTQSVLPGEEDNCVLSGHRDTFFSDLGKLVIGDQLIVKTSAGTFTYVINNTRIVDKDDKTVIVPTNHAVLTVTTCYPFDFIGDAQERYILSADLVINQ